MVAWGETMVKGRSAETIASYRSCELMASLPSEAQTAHEKLLRTQETIETSLGLSSPSNFASRFKNFGS